MAMTPLHTLRALFGGRVGGVTTEEKAALVALVAKANRAAPAAPATPPPRVVTAAEVAKVEAELAAHRAAIDAERAAAREARLRALLEMTASGRAAIKAIAAGRIPAPWMPTIH